MVCGVCVYICVVSSCVVKLSNFAKSVLCVSSAGASDIEVVISFFFFLSKCVEDCMRFFLGAVFLASQLRISDYFSVAALTLMSMS